VHINLKLIKQTLKSRLTTCQLILLLLNILCIIIVVIVVVVLRKQLCSTKKTDVLVIREGTFFGDALDGNAFDDAAAANSLTLDDQLVSVNASWCSDTLISITFIYSNGATSQHGTGDGVRIPSYSSIFTLRSTESFNGVTVYEGVRDIVNPYKPSGTDNIVGICFFTNQSRQSNIFSSSNGTSYSDLFSDYTLAYARGRSYSFIDALQFIWTKDYEQSISAMIANV